VPRHGYRFLAIVDSKSAPVGQTVCHPITLETASEDAFIHAERMEKADGPDARTLLVWSFTQPGLIEQRQISSQAFGESQHPKRRVWLALAAVVLALTFAGILLVRGRSPGRGTPTPIRSVAVLPLENLTGDPSQEYFADGMTDALITELAQVRSLRVFHEPPSCINKGTRKTLPENCPRAAG